MSTTITEGKTLALNAQALDVVRAMRERVQQIANVFGENSPEHAKASSSLAKVLADVLVSGFGDAEVSRDGELSLYVVENGFHYGVIFHPDRDAVERKVALVEDDGPVHQQRVREHYGDLAGSWSMHS